MANEKDRFEKSIILNCGISLDFKAFQFKVHFPCIASCMQFKKIHDFGFLIFNLASKLVKREFYFVKLAQPIIIFKMYVRYECVSS